MTLSEKSLALALFVASIFSSAWWPMMPSWHWLLLGMFASGSIIKLRRGLMSIGVIWGCMVVIVHGNIIEQQKQALFKAGVNITINGKVDSPFTQISHGYEGIVAVSHVNSQSLLPFFKPKVRLITSIPLGVNSEIKMDVELKPITGLKNEVGFDLESFALSQGIVARATSMKASHWIVRSKSSLRQTLITRINTGIVGLHNEPIIRALSYSDRSLLTPGLWKSLRDSGLIHLVSISGLHIGMAFSFGCFLGFLFRLAVPSGNHLPYILGAIFAVAYAWLADFSLPTVRALSVCVIYLFLKCHKLYWSSWRILLLAVSGQLLFEPFSFLGSSFWLSYLSVIAVLIVLNIVRMNQYGWLHTLKQIIVVQIALSLFILPISGYFFSGFSAVSTLFNLVFIPWFSLTVVPMIFVSLLFTCLATDTFSWGWVLVDKSLWPLNWALGLAEGTWFPVSDDSLIFIVLMLLSLFWLRFLAANSVVLIISVAVLCLAFPFKQYYWRVDVLDVGHGLSLLLEKEGKTLLYDTGKSWGGGSIAERVITPILHSRGYSHIDSLILSHLDDDHAGGRRHLEESFEPKSKFSSQLLPDYLPCVEGKVWYWQGLKFEAIWPPKLVKRAFNPHSCVIRVVDSVSKFRILLTGDIEAISEWILIRRPDLLESDIVVVPHHGSKSSSNPRFIEAVNPQVAIASLAKSNRWGMPSPMVQQVYTSLGAAWFDTGESGQVSIYVWPEFWRLKTQRDKMFEPWYRQMLRKGVE
ncbi:DNA internalization-related competence protein ComEC/Rec2 [Vibrio rotiferianus]|uniref:DNA internalization-related competence protein ComEC/Rec2 n=1 Tax=Vibrio rotiferianus TaxID=190895 RepID=UPI00406A39C1